MKVLGDLYHLPSGKHYLLGQLETANEKNEAYALLYDRYVSEEEAPVPWRFPVDNPSGIRVETRRVGNGRWAKVLVDDFEQTAIVGGILCAKTHELLGTGRILVRAQQIDHRLEVERYPSLPRHLREQGGLMNCDVEGNRGAIKHRLEKKRCSLPIYSALMTMVGCKRMVYTVHPNRLAKVPFANSGCLGHFKYNEDDPSHVAICAHTGWAIRGIVSLNSMSAGTIYFPRLASFHRTISLQERSSRCSRKSIMSAPGSDDTFPVELDEEETKLDSS
eukprot:scaffold4603_cov175-Amphora_coffeaeformis.AAC.8